MYKLFYYPRNASWAPHMLLAELGVEYELVLVDRKSEAQKSADYLKLNPTGRIPTLVNGDQVIYESAAIALYLCEKHPESGLIPEQNSPNRAEFFQWLFYLTTSIQSELMLYFYPEKHTMDKASAHHISKAQEKRLTDMFKLVDKELQAKQYLLGEQISVCDYFLFMLSHWASGFEKAPLSFEHLGRYLRQLAHRDSIKTVSRVEGTILDAYQ